MASQIPTRHKAAVYDNPGHISTAVESVETPNPGTGEILVNLTHSGVCNSDFGLMTNGWVRLPPTPKGQVGGHEGVGTVVAFGPGAEKSGLKLGDRVGIKWLAGICGTCLACLSGFDASCSSVKISGLGTPGTFQQYVTTPANYATPIPDGLPSEIAAPLLCGGVTVYAALKKTGAQPGQSVVIPGAGGGLGHLAVQIGSRAMGLRIIGIDVGEKEEFVRSQGAEVFIDISKYSRDEEGSASLRADVKASTTKGLGAAAVVVCTGSKAAYAQAMGFLGLGGTLVCVGLPEGIPENIPGSSPGALIGMEKRIVGSAVGNRKDAIDVLDLALRGVVKTQVVVEPMSNLTSVFERMDKGQLHGRVVLDLS
ncbi:alcohol dehydrogenase II [Thozetella sp. PMI_491]|nr:alcohol dehydrogenase II [Thozetella sp. PMI_491]